MKVEKKNIKPRWRRVLRGLFITVVVMVVGLLVHSVWNYFAGKQLHKEIAEIRAAGQPVTFAELAAGLPKVDDSRNAGRFYGAALELLTRGGEADVALDEFCGVFEKGPGAKPPDELIEDAKEILASNELVLQIVTRQKSARNVGLTSR